MAQDPGARDLYRAHFESFEKSLNGDAGAPLHSVRRKAFERFADVGFPTRREEDWKFTNLAPLMKTPFRVPNLFTLDAGARKAALDELPGDGPRLVFVNGRLDPSLSGPIESEGKVRLMSLAEAFRARPDIIEKYFGHHARHEEFSLVALNTSFVRDGAFIHLTDGAVLDTPIHLLFISTAAAGPTVSHPRNLFVAGRNSQATIVESYWAPGSDVYYTNAVTEVVLEEGAVVDHYRVQRESEAAFHTGSVTVNQARSANYISNIVSLGGGLVRNDLRILLDGEGAASMLNGLYMVGGTQHVDNRTVVDHARPHCSSNEVYKGVLDGKATGVFNGEIIVREDAQKTDAHQLNKNLVLSEEALINTKPRLRINANDVKCTHGATVGMLDEDALFYLRSRGFPREEARNILTYAFAADVIEPMRDEWLRTAIERLVLARLPAGDRLRELV
ncbi:MAG: Fe-S cluster assembly protein SufD [Deltaproteobacteria bacterium]|nr:Fe-S cluster assembly protein SufD [Deltaproteobacteria bacterium]